MSTFVRYWIEYHLAIEMELVVVEASLAAAVAVNALHHSEAVAHRQCDHCYCYMVIYFQVA